MNEKRDGYGNPDSPLYGSAQLREELASYQRLLEYAVDDAVALPLFSRARRRRNARQRILKAAEEYGFARARVIYAEIKESEAAWAALAEKWAAEPTDDR